MAMNVQQYETDEVTAAQQAYDEALDDLHSLRKYAAINPGNAAERELRAQERKVETARRRALHASGSDWGFEPRS